MPNILQEIHSTTLKDKEKLILNGMRNNQFHAIIKELGHPRELLPAALGIVDSTFSERAKQKSIAGSIIDRLLALVEVYHIGNRYFANRKAFLAWLTTSSPELLAMPPIAAMKSLVGIAEVTQLLGKIGLKMPPAKTDQSAAAYLKKPVIVKSASTLHLLWRLPFEGKWALVKEGINTETVYALRQELNLTHDEMASFLGITERSLHLHNKEGLLSTKSSDRLLFLCNLFVKGGQVLGSVEFMNRWLRYSPLTRSGISLRSLSTIVGINEVRHEILRHEYGVF